MDATEIPQPTIATDAQENSRLSVMPELPTIDISKNRERAHRNAQVAFIDGMMRTFFHLLNNNAYRFYKNVNLTELAAKHDDLFYTLSKGYCGEASANLINYLYRNNPDLFDRFIIIRSNHGPFIKDWEAHQVAFVREKGTNQWYAGSPANYSSDKNTNYSDIIYTGTLQDIIAQLEKDYLGTWPDKAQIGKLIAQEYLPPTLVTSQRGNKIGVYTIETKYDLKDINMRGPNVSVENIPILTHASMKQFDNFTQ